MFKEIKPINCAPKPDYYGRNAQFWWGRLLVTGKPYARFIGALPRGNTKQKASAHHCLYASKRRTCTGPVAMPRSTGTTRQDITAWAFQGRVYEADADLEADDVAALALEGENKKRLRLEKAKALQAMTEQLDDRNRRQPIPQDIKMFVWQRDHGRCGQCGSQRELEFDHIIPLGSLVLGSLTFESSSQAASPCRWA